MLNGVCFLKLNYKKKKRYFPSLASVFYSTVLFWNLNASWNPHFFTILFLQSVLCCPFNMKTVQFFFLNVLCATILLLGFIIYYSFFWVLLLICDCYYYLSDQLKKYIFVTFIISFSTAIFLVEKNKERLFIIRKW